MSAKTVIDAGGNAPNDPWVPMVVIALAQMLMSFNVSAIPVSRSGMVSSFNTPPTSVATAVVMYSLGLSGFVMLGAKIGQRCVGIEPIFTPTRGGTDGSRLTEHGVPTPNLFTGMQNIHGSREWVGVQDMAHATKMCIALIQLWNSAKGAIRATEKRDGDAHLAAEADLVDWAGL